MRKSPRSVQHSSPEKAADLQSIADRTAFHLAGIGANLIGAAARLRETEDFDLGHIGLCEAQKDLKALTDVLSQVEEGHAVEAAHMLDDLIFGRVLRRLT